MSLRDKLEASMRGEVSTADLTAYSAPNQDAYDLLDDLPAQGTAQLAAWCAFVLQTHADNLVGSGSAPGYCVSPALEEARVLYTLASAWLERARAAAASESYRLDVIVPQPYPRPFGEHHLDELRAMRKTLETVEARAGTAIESRRGEPVYERLQPTLGVMRAALDAALVLARGRTPTPPIEAALVQSLQGAIDRAYQAGQLLAMPELLGKPSPSPLPRVSSSASLALLLPGDPAFDPWCLTDPIQRPHLDALTSSSAKLDEFWRTYPNAHELLAVQTEIAVALESGVVDYLPEDGAGSLREITSACPWPGAFWAKEAVTLGGQQLDRGDRFSLSTRDGDDGFRCAIVRLSAKAAARLSEADEPLEPTGNRSTGGRNLFDLGLEVLGLWP